MEALYQLSYSPETAWISDCRIPDWSSTQRIDRCANLARPAGRSNVTGQPPDLPGPPGSLTSSIL